MSRRIAPMLALYAWLGGMISLAGWALDIPQLTDWFDKGIFIQPNTAVCAVFSGLGVQALTMQRLRLAAAMGIGVLLVGGLTLLEWLVGASFGIDTLLLFRREWGSFGTIFPGRMGLPASFSWALIGLSLILGAGPRRVQRFSPVITLTTAAISSLSLLGYLYDVTPLYATPYVTMIALQTSTFIMAVSLGIVVSHRTLEPMRTLLDPGGAGLLARRALPLLVVVPVALGYVRVWGQEVGLYDTGTGTGLLVLALIAFLTGIMGWSVRALHVRERRERHAGHQLEASREAELQRRRDMEALMYAAPAAIWVASDPACRYIAGNPAAASLLRTSAQANMSLGAFGDESVRHVSVHRDGAELRPDDLPMRVAARTGRAVPNQDLEFRFADGSSSWAYGNAMPLFDTDHKVRGAIATFVDITPLKQAEVLLRDADRRKDEFLATLAHELRNPLAPIRNALSVLRVEAETSAVHDASGTAARHGPSLEMMTRQVDQLVRLIDDLLDVSRISQGKVNLRTEHIDVVSVLHQAVDACRPLIESAGQRVSVSRPESAVYVDADPIRLAQVFTNLLSNASKFTDESGHIDVAVQQHNGQAVIVVRDNGIGIPSDKLDSIFDLFSQVDQSLEKAEGGLGIGLTLARQLVELQRGHVRARSAGPGAGSEFIVELPLVDAPVRQPSPTPDAEAAPVSQRILVVDDNQDSADTLAMLLELSKHETIVVYDGETAIAAANTHRPDVIFLDIGLPGLNGFDVCRLIRQESWSSDTLIIALTGWGKEEDRRQSEAAGFDAHLVKPVDHTTLLSLLANHVARSA